MSSSRTAMKIAWGNHSQALLYLTATLALAVVTGALAWDSRASLKLLATSPTQALSMPVGSSSSLLHLPLVIAATAVCMWALWNAISIVAVELFVTLGVSRARTRKQSTELEHLARRWWLPSLARRILSSHLASGALALALTAGMGGAATAAPISDPGVHVGAHQIAVATATQSRPAFPDISLTAPLPDHAAVGSATAGEPSSELQNSGEPAPLREHLIRSGESLWVIASNHVRAHLGREDTQIVAEVTAQIYALNRDLIGEDANLIHPGMVLTLPQLEDSSWL